MQVREKTLTMGLRGLWERAAALPWLSVPGIVVSVLLVCLPWLLEIGLEVLLDQGSSAPSSIRLMAC
jgi:hypothetical protein